jgi:1,4-alpha-glucan branching enzyme
VLACLVNFSPVVRHGWRMPLPLGGAWREVLNTDATAYGGSGVGNLGRVDAVAEPLHGRPFSAAVTLPPLAAIWFAPADAHVES